MTTYRMKRMSLEESPKTRRKSVLVRNPYNTRCKEQTSPENVRNEVWSEAVAGKRAQLEQKNERERKLALKQKALMIAIKEEFNTIYFISMLKLLLTDLVVSLCMFTKSLIVKKRVEDVQLGMESYQKKLNITKPQKDFPRIFAKELYIPLFDPPGVVYEDLSHQKRLMRADELYKFSDGTLKKVRDTLHHRLCIGKADPKELGKVQSHYLSCEYVIYVV
ncbi:hypothetical protein Tco_0413154 [Tanacetum coccineum]